MNPKIKDEWVKALRSGEYEQGTSQLKYSDSAGDRYCCLGVLADLAIREGVPVNEEVHAEDRVASTYYDGCFALLPSSVMDWAGLDEVDDDSPMPTLVDMNDKNGRTFSEIADYIEEHV